jgi:hypothetical protein
MRAILVALLTIVSIGSLQAQNNDIMKFSNGFISPAAYTNAYFGFQLPLLPGMKLHSLPVGPANYIFAAEKYEGHAITTLMIALAAPKENQGKTISIGGKSFYLKEDKSHNSEGTLREALYSTELGGQKLTLVAASFSEDDLNRLKHCIESMSFFDPADAARQAGSASVPYPGTASTSSTQEAR